MVSLDRTAMAEVICRRIDATLDEVTRQWRTSQPINHFVIDDLLPVDWAERIRNAFPRGDTMMLRRSLREVKFVAAQMNRYDPLLEEIIYAFQQPGVVERVGRITALRALEPDSLLYAGGISLMAPGHYLNPHIDNSHDKVRERYRVLNLLYYVSPQWDEQAGGNLELWPEGPQGRPVTIISRFNRLAVMVTHQRSWHSVSRVAVPRDRCCVSNYYFSRYPVGEAEYFHVTTFRGRPEQFVRDLVLRADGWARSRLRGLFPQGAKASRHYYERDRND
jgi:Rps23 Pro-64 3,4-dihydroxylase Tpa1-like proline 4-hydroxylase